MIITPFDDAQRLVLRGSNWLEARHLVLDFGGRTAPHFLQRLQNARLWPTAASQEKADLQVSVGFSRRGLEHAFVPKHVLAAFAQKAPAFFAGAALRAHRHLGLSGRDGPGAWGEAFSFTALDAVLSLHGTEKVDLDKVVEQIKAIALDAKVQVRPLLPARRLDRPPEEKDPEATWAHFRFRDGLAHVSIEGWTPPKVLEKSRKVSRYEPGEFLLGHPQKSGANPWITGPGARVLTNDLLSFFHNGSFGVLHQIEQNVTEFEKFLPGAEGSLERNEFKAKLCGRHPDGRPAAAANGLPKEDFDYEGDPKGYLCPFGSHVRRMNPRGDGLPHAFRARPLIRRGMPYGSAAWINGSDPREKRGLMGQFFCASIEDQYEHLVGQWADRVPLGSEDRGGARDPMFGAHQAGDGAFEIPLGEGKAPIMQGGLEAFTQTMGVAYLFYPRLPTLQGIAKQSPWYTRPEDHE